MVNDSRLVNLQTNRGQQRRLNPRALNDHLNAEMSKLENDIDVKIQHLSSTITENFSRKDSKFLIAYAKCAFNATCQVNYIFRVKEKVVVNNLVEISVEITNIHNHGKLSNSNTNLEEQRIANCPFFDDKMLDHNKQPCFYSNNEYISQQKDDHSEASQKLCPFFDCPQAKLFMKSDSYAKSLESIKTNENFKADVCPIKSVLTNQNFNSDFSRKPLNKRMISEIVCENDDDEMNSEYYHKRGPSAFKKFATECHNLKDISLNSASTANEACAYKHNWIEILKEVIKRDLPLFPIDKQAINKEESFLHYYNLFFNHFISKMQMQF
jgi:hypothetical protein